MATVVLSNEFMQSMATEEAWKELSGNFNWSETTLEKYQDKVDWDEISRNSRIRWTIPMIQKFQKKINWDVFSDNADEDILTEKYLDAFKEKWNWRNLSNNSSVEITEELLERFADKWDWMEIIDRWNNNLYEKKSIEFYEKYKEYIPASQLWRNIVQQRAKQLANEITT